MQSDLLRDVLIVTRNRDALLNRAAIGYADALARRGGGTLTVVDDSDAPSLRASAAHLDALRVRQPSVAIRRVGPIERRALADVCAAALGGAAFVGRVLEGELPGAVIRTGASRTLALLLHAGRAAVHADDDTTTHGARVGMDEIAQAPVDAWRYTGHVDVRSAVRSLSPLEELDVLALHGRYLGRVEGGAPIVVTQLGCVGEDGTSSSMPRVVADAGVGATEAEYRALRGSNAAVIASDCVRVGRDGRLIGFSTAMDFRTSALPPCFPFGRNQLSLFGATLRFVEPHALRAALPYVVLHDPIRTIHDREAHLFGGDDSGGPHLCEFVTIVMRGVKDASNPADRLRALGDHFVAASEWSDADWRNKVLDVMIGGLDRARERVRALAASEHARPSRRRDLLALAERFDVWLKAPTATPIELSGMLPRDAERIVRALLRDYGELLRAWPTLIEVAKTPEFERASRGSFHV
jgi:hypothetical protein